MAFYKTTTLAGLHKGCVIENIPETLLAVCRLTCKKLGEAIDQPPSNSIFNHLMLEYWGCQPPYLGTLPPIS